MLLGCQSAMEARGKGSACFIQTRCLIINIDSKKAHFVHTYFYFMEHVYSLENNLSMVAQNHICMKEVTWLL